MEDADRFAALRKRVEAELAAHGKSRRDLEAHLATQNVLNPAQRLSDLFMGSGFQMALKQLNLLDKVAKFFDLAGEDLLRDMDLVHDPVNARAAIRADRAIPAWARRAMITLYDASVPSEDEADEGGEGGADKPVPLRPRGGGGGAGAAKAASGGKTQASESASRSVTKAAKKVEPSTKKPPRKKPPQP